MSHRPLRVSLLPVLALVVVQLQVSAVRAQAQVTVTAADPPAAEQGLVLDVEVLGSGFKKNAIARFYITGTGDPGGVLVNSTRYVNSGRLVASITIADAAALGRFDIEVANPDGRTGKGTELFSVLEKSNGVAWPMALVAEFAGAADDRLYGDGGGAYGHGVDQSWAELATSNDCALTFFTWASNHLQVRHATLELADNGYGDLTSSDTPVPRPSDLAGPVTVRADVHVLSVLTPDGPALDLPIDIRQLAPGQTVNRWGYVNVFLASGQQYSLRWGFGDVFPASHLAVTCVAGTEAGCTSWRVAPVGRGLLRRVTKVNRKTTQIDAIGWFEVPFDLTLTVR